MRIHTKLIIVAIVLINGVLLIYLVKDYNKQFENLREGIEIEHAMQDMQGWQPRQGVILVEYVSAPSIERESQFRSGEVTRLLGGDVSIYFAYLDRSDWKFAREDFQIRSGPLDSLLDYIRSSSRKSPPSSSNALDWNEAIRKAEQSNHCERFSSDTFELRQKLDKATFAGEDMLSWLATSKMCQSLKRVVVWVSPSGGDRSVLRVDKYQKERNVQAQQIRRSIEQEFFEDVLSESP